MFGEHPKKLSDILTGNSWEEVARRFDEVEAAPDFTPVPAGTYEVDVVDGRLCQSQQGKVGYTCVFEISAGEYRGRKIWHTAWLTEAATQYTKRDLLKLGICKLDQCKKPLPPGIFCTIKVSVRTGDDGTQSNRVTHIEAGGVRTDPTADQDFVPPPAKM